MAGGTATPIEQIRTGDQVVSADPKTGRDVTGTVTAAYVNHDHQFTDLQFTAADGGTTSLHTTSHHRIWDQTTHTFANATDLQTGHQIHTTDGQTWTLTSKHTWHGSQRMYDITVGSVHTFYVLAGQIPILVHNCGGADDVESAISDSTIIVRGGQSEMPAAGEVFSGSQGSTLNDAAAGVPHGTIRSTTAGEIRAGGGSVEYSPEFNAKVGRTNYQHVDVCLGKGSCPFGDPFPNPVPKQGRFGFSGYPYDKLDPQ